MFVPPILRIGGTIYKKHSAKTNPILPLDSNHIVKHITTTRLPNVILFKNTRKTLKLNLKKQNKLHFPALFYLFLQ